MAIKVDMSKACDTVKRSFLIAIMRQIGFCDRWLNWILATVSSVTCAFNVNGVKTGFVVPREGLDKETLSP